MKQSTYPHPLHAWWTVGLFCLAAVFSYTDRLILGSLVDPIKATLGVSDSAVGVLQGAAFVLVYVTSGLWLGRLADQSRRLTILLIGSTTWCVGTVASGLAPSFWSLVVARILVGVGEATLAPAAVSIIGDSFPSTQRGVPLSVFMLGYFIGGPASIAIGSVMLSLANAGRFSGVPIVGALEPWRAVLVLVGLIGLSLPVLFLTLREPTRNEARQVLPIRGMLRRLSEDRRSLAPTYLAMGLLSIGDYGTFTWVPSVLSRRFAMPPAELGEIFGLVTGLAGAVGCLLGGVGSDAAARRYSTRGRLLLSLGAAMFATAGAVLISCGRISWVLFGLGLWTLCSGIGAISGVAAIQSLVPSEYRGVGMALMAFCNVLLGLGCGPSVVAVITEHIYGNPALVGHAITAVAAPAGAIGGMLFLYASSAVAPAARIERQQVEST